MREDRTPGGKHRAKKLRADETDVSTTSVGPAPLINWNGCEQDEQLLSRLVDSRPEAVNTVEGMPDQLTAHLLYFSTLDTILLSSKFSSSALFLVSNSVCLNAIYHRRSPHINLQMNHR